jgi:hypothetical protein
VNILEQEVLMEKKNNSKAVAGMVLGIVGVFAAILPLLGLPVNVVGLVMGILGIKSEKKGMAKAGVILSSIGLVLTIANAVAGAIIALNMMK